MRVKSQISVAATYIMYLGLIRWKIIKRIQNIIFPSVASPKTDMAERGPSKARFGLKNPQLKDFGWILAVLEVARSSIHFNTGGGVKRNRERVWYFEDKMIFQ